MDSINAFIGSLRIQLRILGALLMREIITRYGRDNIGFLWLFIEPMLFTLGVMGLWVAAGLGHRSNLPIAAFAITGYSSVLLWRNCATRASMAIPPNLGLLYHRNVRVLDLLITRVVLELSGATISFVVLVILFVNLGAAPPPEDIVNVLIGWICLAWFGAALALVIGAASAYTDVVERIWHPIAYLLFPLSGAAFMVEWLPRELQKYVLLLPMVHGVELLREGYFGSVVRTHYDIFYLIVSCMVTTLIGLVLAKGAGQRIEVQ